MRSSVKLGALSAAMVAAALLAPTGNASAGVMSIAGKSTVETQSTVDQVHWRRWCNPHRHHVWHYGWHRHNRFVFVPRYRYVYYPYYRSAYYPYRWRSRYSYYPYGYGWNPGAAVAGAALGLASAPLWGLSGGYPYYW
jgi:hypothetical protein